MDEEGIKNTNLMDKGAMLDETNVVLSLPAQVSSSLCPNSWLDPNLATIQSSRSVSCSAPQFHSSSPSPLPEPRHIPSPAPAPIIDQVSNLTSSASPQRYSYPSNQVPYSSLSLRSVIRRPSPTFGASHPGIKSNPTLGSLQSRAPQLSYVPVVFGSSSKTPSQVVAPSSPSAYSTPSGASYGGKQRSIVWGKTPTQVAVPSDPSSYSTPSGPSHGSKRTSIVWTAFERKVIDGRQYAICNTCTSKLTAGSGYGTRHLHSHMQRCKRLKTFDTRQQPKGINIGIEKQKVEPHNCTFDQEVSRRDIVNAIILHGYPLNILNHYGLQKFIRGLQPMFKMVTTNTIKKDILNIYDSEKDKIICLLEKLDCRVAITTKIWTAKPTKKSYMAITAHYIDEAWLSRSRLLRFIYIPHPDDVEVLTEYLMDALLELGLDRKLSTIMVDDVKNDPTSHNFLDKLDESSLLLDGDVLHICCFGSILNIIAKDVLGVISEVIDNVRNGVLYWTASVQRMYKLEEACHQLCVPYTKKLCLDNGTCWKSTLLMIQTALLYKDVFFYLEQEKTCHTSLPSDHDWMLVKEICGNLQPFYNITESFCGTNNFTLNCYFPKICEIKIAMSKWFDSPLEIVQVIASQTMEKYEKYWSLCHRIIGIACVFDPRYKLKLIEYFFKTIYSDEAMVHVNRVRDDCHVLQLNYQSKGRPNHNLGASSASSLASTECSEEDALIDFDLFVASQVPARSEMDLYLEECVLPRTANFDILNWWKANGLKFPTLQKIAMDILAIPGSISASKSTSGNNKMLSSHRSRLNHTITEALMCTQNWLLDEFNATCSSGTQLVASTLDDEDEDKAEEKDEAQDEDENYGYFADDSANCN